MFGLVFYIEVDVEIIGYAIDLKIAELRIDRSEIRRFIVARVIYSKRFHHGAFRDRIVTVQQRSRYKVIPVAAYVE